MSAALKFTVQSERNMASGIKERHGFDRLVLKRKEKK